MRVQMFKVKEDKIVPSPSQGYGFSSPDHERYYTRCIPLHKAALSGDWDTASKLLSDDHNLVRAPITLGGETILHIAALEGHLHFLSNLLRLMNTDDLEIENNKGCSPLFFAAATKHLDVAKLLVRKNRNLPLKRSSNGITSVYMAALQGNKAMAEYLFPLSGFESWTREDQIALLTTCIDSRVYDLALRIVELNEILAVSRDANDESPLEVLARTPLEFRDRNQWWKRTLNTIILFTKRKRTLKKAAQCDAYRLFDCLWNKMIRQQVVEGGTASRLLFIAASSGNEELVIELIRRYPDFLYEMNDSRHSIFHIAVSRRYVRVFNLVYELSGVKELITTYIDYDSNNILHLAAKLAPENKLNSIPGKALQMQREVLWYKEVEKIVQPSYKTMKNSDGQTPQELFIIQHKNLMKEGEKEMKQTAKACIIVALLITTIVFTSTYTVPSSYNNNIAGAPLILHENKTLFRVFAISEAVAALSSLTSMLMFLSILTSRFTEMDFLRSLPFCLVIGMSSLLASVLALMVAFCTLLSLYQHGLLVMTVLLVFFACMPIMSISFMFSIWGTALPFSYGGHGLFRPNERLFT